MKSWSDFGSTSCSQELAAERLQVASEALMNDPKCLPSPSSAYPNVLLLLDSRLQPEPWSSRSIRCGPPLTAPDAIERILPGRQVLSSRHVLGSGSALGLLGLGPCSPKIIIPRSSIPKPRRQHQQLRTSASSMLRKKAHKHSVFSYILYLVLGLLKPKACTLIAFAT